MKKKLNLYEITYCFSEKSEVNVLIDQIEGKKVEEHSDYQVARNMKEAIGKFKKRKIEEAKEFRYLTSFYRKQTPMTSIWKIPLPGYKITKSLEKEVSKQIL